jgi:hypothetical protein
LRARQQDYHDIFKMPKTARGQLPELSLGWHLIRKVVQNLRISHRARIRITSTVGAGLWVPRLVGQENAQIGDD